MDAKAIISLIESVQRSGLKLSEKKGTSKDPRYYADYDEDTDMYHVFDSHQEPHKGVASYADYETAERKAAAKNKEEAKHDAEKKK